MMCIACLLEEPSAKEMLKVILPKVLPSDQYYPKFVVFEGKQDLEKNLERRLRGWQLPDTIFLIMRDQDSGDCIQIKENLHRKAQDAGKDESSLIRIACQELESFYLGDLLAVEMGLGISGLSGMQNRSKYRAPDNLGNPAEELKNVTNKAYQKVAGSRSIAPYLNLDGLNRSHSFGVLIDGLKRIA